MSWLKYYDAILKIGLNPFKHEKYVRNNLLRPFDGTSAIKSGQNIPENIICPIRGMLGNEMAYVDNRNRHTLET